MANEYFAEEHGHRLAMFQSKADREAWVDAHPGARRILSSREKKRKYGEGSKNGKYSDGGRGFGKP